jgi:hypothetical protein
MDTLTEIIEFHSSGKLPDGKKRKRGSKEPREKCTLCHRPRVEEKDNPQGYCAMHRSEEKKKIRKEKANGKLEQYHNLLEQMSTTNYQKKQEIKLKKRIFKKMRKIGKEGHKADNIDRKIEDLAESQKDDIFSDTEHTPANDIRTDINKQTQVDDEDSINLDNFDVDGDNADDDLEDEIHSRYQETQRIEKELANITKDLATCYVE